MIRSLFDQRPLDAAVADAAAAMLEFDEARAWLRSALAEEAGLRPRLLERPAAAAVRSFLPGCR